MKLYSDTLEMSEQKKNKLKIRSTRREVLREVLHEVFQTYPFYNSLILMGLWKTTGGLGKIRKKQILKNGKSQPQCKVS